MRRRPGRVGDALALLIIVAAVIVVVGCAMINAAIVYGDWTCAFAKCVKVKE